MVNSQKKQELNWNIQYNKNTAQEFIKSCWEKNPKPQPIDSHILNQLK